MHRPARNTVSVPPVHVSPARSPAGRLACAIQFVKLLVSATTRRAPRLPRSHCASTIYRGMPGTRLAGSARVTNESRPMQDIALRARVRAPGQRKSDLTPFQRRAALALRGTMGHISSILFSRADPTRLPSYRASYPAAAAPETRKEAASLCSTPNLLRLGSQPPTGVCAVSGAQQRPA